MLSERDIELAHPEAFDFVFGNLPAGQASRVQPPSERVPLLPEASSTSTATSAGSSSNLPPHVEPPADLEDRTVAAMVAALADQRAKTDRRTGRRRPSRHPGLPDSRAPASG